MYNGIGLTTARGSGTNGYVQTNKAFIRNRKERVEYKTEADFKIRDREPNIGIMEHERKRKLEVKCIELKELMESQCYSSEDIEKKVTAFREKLLEKDRKENPKIELDEQGRPLTSGTHETAAASLDRNKKLRDAFGISSDYVDGTSLDPLRKQKEMEKRVAEQTLSLSKNRGKGNEAISGSDKKRRKIEKEEDDKNATKALVRARDSNGDRSPFRPRERDEARRNKEKPPASVEERQKQVKKSRKRERSHSPGSSSESSSSESEADTKPLRAGRYPGKDSSTESSPSPAVHRKRNSSSSPDFTRQKEPVRNRLRSADGSPNPSPWKPERPPVEVRAVSPRDLRGNVNYRRVTPPLRRRRDSPDDRRRGGSRHRSRTPERRRRSARQPRSRSRSPSAPKRKYRSRS